MSASSLKKRIFSGLVLAPLVVFIIVAGGWFFKIMVLLAGLLALYEFVGLAGQGKHPYLHYILGTMYLAVCTASYLMIRFGFDQGAWLALVAILCVWASDIGAYATGKTIGGPKMTPKLSPNKTWAGLGGAMFFCGLALVILHYIGPFFEPYIHTDLALKTGGAPHIFVAGLFLGLAGQGGDLLVSFYKRRVGAKDTGQLIPGHGGLLDRIDSLLLVCPVFLGILILCL